MYVVRIIVRFHRIIFLYLWSPLSNILPSRLGHVEDRPREMEDADEKDYRLQIHRYREK
jgi:hypothetical protein